MKNIKYFLFYKYIKNNDKQNDFEEIFFVLSSMAFTCLANEWVHYFSVRVDVKPFNIEIQYSA